MVDGKIGLTLAVALLFTLATRRLPAQADSVSRQTGCALGRGSTACATRTDSAAAPRRCWRGRPLPQCDSFWISEVGVDFVVTTPRERASLGTQTKKVDNFGTGAVLTVGPMFNTGPLRAWGGTLSLSTVSNGAGGALEVRRRWWTPEGSSFDLTFGPLATPIGRAGRNSAVEYGLTSAGYLVGGDVVNLRGRVDLVLTGRHPILGTSIGAGLGSRPAVYGAIIFAVLAHFAFQLGGGGT
jgi:hypothetical protein